MRFVGDVQMSLYKMVKLNKSAHSSMDRIAASEAVGAGSIPAGRTIFRGKCSKKCSKFKNPR